MGKKCLKLLEGWRKLSNQAERTRNAFDKEFKESNNEINERSIKRFNNLKEIEKKTTKAFYRFTRCVLKEKNKNYEIKRRANQGAKRGISKSS